MKKQDWVIIWEDLKLHNPLSILKFCVHFRIHILKCIFESENGYRIHNLEYIFSKVKVESQFL